MTLDIIKDLLGLLGAILTVVPFLRDFAHRRELRRWLDLGRIFSRFRPAIDPIAEAQNARLREPTASDMHFVMFGILLLIASFAVSLYNSAYGAC